MQDVLPRVDNRGTRGQVELEHVVQRQVECGHGSLDIEVVRDE